MRKESMEQPWKVALAAVAVIAVSMALYAQLVERRSRREEDRIAAARLEEAIAASRAEIVQQLRTEIARENAAEPPVKELLPNAVLRRGEEGEGSALRQVVGSVDSQQAAAIAELRKSLDALSRQTEQSSRALRRDLETLRSEIRRDLDASDKTVSLLLIAMVPLLAQLLYSIVRP